MRTRQTYGKARRVQPRQRRSGIIARDREAGMRLDPGTWQIYNESGYYTDEDNEAINEGYFDPNDPAPPQSMQRYASVDPSERPWQWPIAGRGEEDYLNTQVMGWPEIWGPQNPHMARANYYRHRGRRGRGQ